MVAQKRDSFSHTAIVWITLTCCAPIFSHTDMRIPSLSYGTLLTGCGTL